jgi:hypothetical protein
MIQIEPDAPPLLVIRKKRHRPKVGDVFALQLVDGLYRFGRVFHTAVPIGGKDDCGHLILVYRYAAAGLDGCPARLLPDAILGPPMVTIPVVWSRGYFVHLQNRPIAPEEVPMPGPCFSNYGDSYFDADGNVVPLNPKLAGFWEFTSEWGIGTDLTAALAGRGFVHGNGTEAER